MTARSRSRDSPRGMGRRWCSTGSTCRWRRGAVCALLGPNGAGKTTAVRVLTTLDPAGRRPGRGGRHRRRPAAAGGAAADRPHRAAPGGRRHPRGAGRTSCCSRRLHHLDRRAAGVRADELLEQVGLADTGRQPVRQFSGGMRRRLDIAAGLVLAPEVLFLDEPTTGLDPAGRRDVWEAVRALVAGGTTVLLTTQYLEEAEQLADDVCVLDGGRVVARGTPRELTAAIGGTGWSSWSPIPAGRGRRPRWPSARRPSRAAGRAAPGERVVVPVARRRGVVGARGAGPGRGRHRGRRRRPAPDHPRRGVPADHRPGRRAHGGAGMTALRHGR